MRVVRIEGIGLDYQCHQWIAGKLTTRGLPRLAAKATIFSVEFQCNLLGKKAVAKTFGAAILPTFLMAKTSWIERNDRKKATVAKYAAIRAELKAKGDYVGLQSIPRDASPTRVVNRCAVSGRRRAFLRRFGVSRITFRELASHGLIPGVTKSSW